MKIMSYRTTMPFDNSDGALSPTTDKSKIPTNNIPTIQDILDGTTSIRDLVPDAGGNWGKGDDIDHSYRETGDDYKREQRDMEIINNGTKNTDKTMQDKWVLFDGVKEIKFPSFPAVQKYMKEKGTKPVSLRKVAAMVGVDNKVVEDLLNKCFMLESIDPVNGTKEIGASFCVADGYLITCAHVISKYNKMLIGKGLNVNIEDKIVNVVIGNERIAAEVIDVSFEEDIALIKADINSQPFKFDTNYDIGTDIVAIGSPHGYDNHVSFGKIGSTERLLFRYNGAPEYMFVDLSVYPGNSGGPVVNDTNGMVVGMVIMIVSPDDGYGLNAALPSSYIVEFLRKNNVA